MNACPQQLSLSVSHDLTSDQAVEWDNLQSTVMAGRVYSSSRWFKFIAQADGVPTTLYRVYRGDRLVLGASGDIMPVGVPPQYDVGQMMRSTGLSQEDALLPSAVLTTRAGRTCDIRFDPTESTSARAEAFAFLISEFLDLAFAREAMSACLLHIPTSSWSADEALNLPGAAMVPTHRSYYLPVTFSSFDEYLASLSSGRRAAVRRERRKCDEVVAFDLVPLAQNITSQSRLLAINAAKYGREISAESLHLRAELLVEIFGAQAMCLEAVAEGLCVGALQVIVSDGVLHASMVGVDEAAPKHWFVYLNLCYVQLIEHALRMGCHRIDFAQEQGDLKTSRGCVVEQHGLLRLPTRRPYGGDVIHVRDVVG